MTYIELINKFWSLDEDWEFTCCETRLYFYLLKTANRLGWVDSWTRSDTKVSSDVGVSVNSMKSARNRLVQAGLITFKSGGKGQRNKTRYQISYQNLTPKVEPKVEPKPLQYNVRALDKDKDKDNYLSPPRAYEEIPNGIFEKGLDECYGELKSNTSWMEVICMNTRLCGYKDFAPPDFYDYLDKFFMKLQNEGEMVKSPQDAMSHFARWLNIELKKRTNNESKSTTGSIYEQKRIDSERRKSKLMAEFAEADAKFLAEQEAKRSWLYWRNTRHLLGWRLITILICKVNWRNQALHLRILQ